jgi:hypothetical protein
MAADEPQTTADNPGMSFVPAASVATNDMQAFSAAFCGLSAAFCVPGLP